MRPALNASFVALLLAALLAGCAGVTPLPAPDAEPGGRYLPLTTPIIALGDTQEHLSTGFPLHDNDSAVNAYVEVAQRPPEQALFGRRLMEWALHSHPDEPFIHLGDVMDLSCRIEAERMTKIFRAAPHVGAILPGNHDGLMFGIYAYGLHDREKADKVLPEVSRWNNACRRGAGELDTRHKSENEAFSKREFIALYIQRAQQGPPGKTGPGGAARYGQAFGELAQPRPRGFPVRDRSGTAGRQGLRGFVHCAATQAAAGAGCHARHDHHRSGYEPGRAAR